MSQYHTDSRCGYCKGPLEIHRDAICETCAPEAPLPMIATDDDFEPIAEGDFHRYVPPGRREDK